MKTIFCILAAALCCQPSAFAAAEAAPADRGGWVLKVNGSPIYQDEVSRRLWSVYGPEVVESFITEKLLRQEAARLKISVKPQDVNRLYDETEQKVGKEGLAAEMKREGFTPAEFRSRIEMRLLSEAVVMKKAPVSVSDAELKQVFEKQKDQLGRPESVRLSRLLFKTEKEAQDAVSKLKAGASFADMASKLSIDKLTKGKGGSVGIVPVSALVPEVAKVVSGLEVGGISKPIDDVDGFYVLRLDERLPAAPANFDEIKVQLREAVTGVKMRQALPQIIAELRKNAKITQPEAGKKSK